MRQESLPGPIGMAGQLSWEDGLHALELAMNPGRVARAAGASSSSSVAVGLVICFLIALAPIIAMPRDAGSYLFLPLALLIAMIALWRRWLLKYDYARQHGVFAVQERWITEKGVQRKVGENWALTPWSSFSRFRCSDKVFLLYNRPSTTYLIFPRGLFAAEDEWQAAVQFIRTRLPER